MNVNHGILRLLAITLLAGLAAGCGGNPLNRQPVSGTVTLDGQPLDQGSIEFRTEQTQSGVSSGAVIKEGKYAVPEDKGLPPGKYRVLIFSAKADTSPAPTGPPGSGPYQGDRPTIERIPPWFNVNSDKIVEIVDGQANVFDFEIRTR